MGRGEAEDAGGLTPVKDDNEAAARFVRRTLLFFNCFDYKLRHSKRADEDIGPYGGAVSRVHSQGGTTRPAYVGLTPTQIHL